jgi:2-dehydro-3-deoxygalactonokinase
MEKFLSCDWGTSSFRIKLVEIPGLKIIAEKNSAQGIVKTFELWKQNGKAEDARLIFYLDFIQEHIRILEKKLDTSFNELPLIISGMASSTMGMIDLPYKDFPFSADGSDLITKIIEANDTFTHKTIIISGAKTNDDAMRGEETQLAGCFHDDTIEQEEQIFVFPGTHSKHIVVKNGKAVTVKTYMTGEFFELFSKKSILSDSVEEGNNLLQKNIQSFEKGILNSIQLNLLHSCFLVRTNHLFNKFTKQENYYYLSGLLIGTEMKELMNDDHSSITLVSNAMLSSYYETAFNVLNKGKAILKIQNADDAFVQGQFKILARLPHQ